MLADGDFDESSTARTVSATPSIFICMAEQERLLRSGNTIPSVLQEATSPSCSYGAGKRGQEKTKNHHSIPARLTEMAGSAHSTQSALKPDGDTRTHTHTLCALGGGWGRAVDGAYGGGGPRTLTGPTVPPDVGHLLGLCCPLYVDAPQRL